MYTYIIRRLLLMLLVMWGVVTLVFFLLHLIPGDPVDIMLGEHALPTDKQALRKTLGLDRALHSQYLTYLSGVMKGDLGSSVHSKKPVLHDILERFPASAELMGGAMFVALLMAIPLGIVSAMKPHSVMDGTAMFVSFLGISIPNFWLGPLLIILFSIQLDWLPVNERGGIDHLILPSLTLGTALAAMLSRLIRGSLLDVLNEEYIRTARAKGLHESRVILNHALRNALIPVITVAGLQVGMLLSGTIITESIFDWPGIGTLLLEGIYGRDYPLVQGCILFISVMYVLVNLITDVSYKWADPRVRLE